MEADALNTRTITGTIVRPSGAAWPNATLTFRLRARFAVAADVVLPACSSRKDWINSP